jgi:formate hydrogenlyase subunit 6/NADH:ubiquinone oxidoreductase subunit I
MAELFGLGTVDKILNRSFINVDSKGCIRARHKNSKCSRCKDICPADAIELQRTPKVDNYKCIGCGMCDNLCPTGALTLIDFPYKELSALIKEKKRIVYGCFINDNDGNVLAPCVGSLNEGILLTSIRDNPAILNHTRCAKCPYNEGADIATKKVVVLNEILSASSRTRIIDITTKKPNDIERIITEEDDRRDFIKQLGVEGLELLVRLMPFQRKEPEKRLKLDEKTMPSKHALFINRILDYGKPEEAHIVSTADIELASIEANESCDGCEMCSTFCPTGAITMERYEEEDVAALEFDSKMCVRCDLCIDICPKDALGYEDSIDIRRLFEDAKKLRELELKKCAECSKSYIFLTSGSEYCLTCKKEHEIKEYMLNEIYKTNK